MVNFIKKIFHRNKELPSFIHADEVFMDGRNMPGFDMHQMEGVIEKSISETALDVLAVVVVGIMIIFTIRSGYLQIIKGDEYFAKSENNRLQETPLFAERGVIYDRNQTELSWNVPALDPTNPFLERDYIHKPGFSHLIGYVGYPTRDASGVFWRESIVGKEGIEKIKNKELAGINGRKLLELNVNGEVTNENMGSSAIPGSNITLTIDAGIQSELYSAIADQAKNLGFVGGAGTIVNIHTGEIIALVTYPEYDMHVLSRGTDKEAIQKYYTDSRKPFLNRALSGLYTPGSIVKPYMAIAALQEKLITPDTTVYSSGQIEIPNRYDKDRPQIFRDWKEGGHGTVNVYTAIAESVNTFFYAIGGGWRGQQGLGIDRINEYMNKFKIAEPVITELSKGKKGTIPSQAWKVKNFKEGAWRLGDTYNSSIGQFGFQVGILPVARAVGAIANNGVLIEPYVISGGQKDFSQFEKISGIDKQNYDIMRRAMRETVLRGTAQSMNLPYVHVAAKTGTAQVGANRQYMNSWTTGFFPYEDPQYAFTVVMEQGPKTNVTGASSVMRRLFEWMYTNNPEYVGLSKKSDPIVPIGLLEKTITETSIANNLSEELSTLVEIPRDTVEAFYMGNSIEEN